MKTLNVFLALLSLLFIIEISSQIYVPLVPNDSLSWKITEYSWGNKTESYLYFSGDTNANGNNYSKVYQSNNLYSESSNKLRYLLREENKVVYSKNKSNNTETILYDFSLSINDTLTYSDSEKGILVKIDSIELENNLYRKQYYFYVFENFGVSDTQIITEGLGNLKNSIKHPFGLNVSDYGIETSCIFSPTELLYKSNNVSSSADCYILDNPVGIKEIYKNNFSVYPNPIDDKIFLTKKIVNSTISIFTTKGVVLIQKDNFEGDVLDVSSLSRGIYFLKIDGEINGIQKIIKK